MFFEIGLSIATHLIIPTVFLIWLWWGGDRSKLDWFVKLLVVGLYTLHIFFIGRWDWLSYYLRFVLAIGFFIAASKSFLDAKSLPLYPDRKFKNYVNLVINSLIIALFLNVLTSYIPQGYTVKEPPIQLALPLKQGRYYVGQGGNSPALNYHNPHPAQLYALDIVKLNQWGARATGIYPRSLTNYAIFGATIYSPCNGTIGSTVNDLPDLIPPEKDPRSPAGNHISIACQSADVVLAHLQQGSLKVREGETVKVGQEIAKVGNSGNTTEPHLHIHARKGNTGKLLLDGEGIPMVFDGDFLVRNSVFSPN
jgi:Peptidase family M23